MEFRRFCIKKENEKDFTAWCMRNCLSRDDLIYILRTVKLNPECNGSPDNRISCVTGAGELNALRYLLKRFDERQVQVLAYCLTHELPVGLYGSGLGKSTLAARLKDAGYRGIYAPEDCSLNCDSLTVTDANGAVALCVKKKSSGSDVPEDSFTDKDLRAVIEDVSEHIR